MAHPTVVAGAEEHLDACAAILASLPLYQSYGLTRERARRTLASALGDRLVVAVDGDVVVGHAWFLPRGGFGRSGYLKQIAVHPDHQGRGIGDALLSTLEADHLGAGGVMLMVTETNGGARRFYERRGYVQVGAIPGYAHPDHTECIYFRAR